MDTMGVPPGAYTTRCPPCVLFLQYEYLWADGVKVKKPTRLSAPEYINNLFDWIESQVSHPLELQTALYADLCSCRYLVSSAKFLPLIKCLIGTLSLGFSC